MAVSSKDFTKFIKDKTFSYITSIDIGALKNFVVFVEIYYQKTDMNAYSKRFTLCLISTASAKTVGFSEMASSIIGVKVFK